MNATDTPSTVSDLATRYLQTWTAPDDAGRRAAIAEVWAPDGRLVVSSLGIEVIGHDAIASHTGGVHEQLIAGRGLRFTDDQEVEALEGTLLRWSMTAPDGTVVGRGADLVLCDDDGRAQTVYMFMGVD